MSLPKTEQYIYVDENNNLVYSAEKIEGMKPIGEKLSDGREVGYWNGNINFEITITPATDAA
jgi:hypothetical protein